MPAVARGARRLRLPLQMVGALLVLAACATHPDLAADRAELLRIHDLHRQAHVERRADLLVSTFADTFRSISGGTVDAPTRADSRERFQAYFDRSTFLAWDDLAAPIIRISPDGRMAYVMVQKEVRVTTPDGSGAVSEAHTVYAWLEVYEKDDGVWRLHAIASTDHPGSPANATED